LTRKVSIIFLLTILLWEEPVISAEENYSAAFLGLGDVKLEYAEDVKQVILEGISSSDRYELTEKEKTEEILKNEGMEFCAADDCALEIGRILGVDKGIFGSLLKMEERYYLNLTRMDVKGGRVDVKGRDSSSSLEGIRKVADNLIKRLLEIEESDTVEGKFQEIASGITEERAEKIYKAARINAYSAEIKIMDNKRIYLRSKRTFSSWLCLAGFVVSVASIYTGSLQKPENLNGRLVYLAMGIGSLSVGVAGIIDASHVSKEIKEIDVKTEKILSEIYKMQR